jgi:hypothetical protein
MSSAYHPQTDGATERANRTVTQMLRQCINNKQTDWVSKLPAIEFAINSARSESTGYAPFFLNSGQMPRPMIWDSAGTGTTMYCSQRSTEPLQCICNNIATKRARSSTVRRYYIYIIENRYTAFAMSAIYTVSLALSHQPLISAAAPVGDRQLANLATILILYVGRFAVYLGSPER